MRGRESGRIRLSVKPAKDEVVEIRFTLTVGEFREAYGLMLRNSTFQCKLSYWFRRWLGPVLGLWILGCAMIIRAGNGSFALVLVLFLVGTAALVAPFRFRVMLAKLFRLQKLDQEISLNVDSEGLVIKRVTRDADTRYGWSAIERCLESKGLIVLFPSKVQFIPLPKRAMTAEQQQEFRALLAAHVPGSASPLPAGAAVS
jgi:hypothetical protein